MCLEIIYNDEKIEEGFGHKQFLVMWDKNQEVLCSFYQGNSRKPIPIDQWICASDYSLDGMQPLETNKGSFYPQGFHIMLTESVRPARFFNAVEFRKAHTIGEEFSYGKTAVALEMRVLPENEIVLEIDN